MKLAHNIELRIFVKENDIEEHILKKVHEIFPYDEFKKENIEFESKISEGFEDKKIKVITVFTKRQRHATKILTNLMHNLKQEQKDILLKQLESRLDEKLHFYIRLDKDKLLNNIYELTDSGNCFWIKICVAAYPHKREIAIDLVKHMLSL